ncbi:hypothetical protein G0U57_014362, partial [Chelydra serpentina]
EPPVTPSVGALAEDRGRDRSLLPVAAVPVLGRRSRQDRRLPTLTELTTVWGSSEDSDSHPDSGAGLEPRGLDPFPSPPQGVPPPQHLFTSKTVGSSPGPTDSPSPTGAPHSRSPCAAPLPPPPLLPGLGGGRGRWV